MEHITTFPKLLGWITNRNKAHVYVTSRADVWRRLLGFLKQGVPNSFRLDTKPFLDALLRVLKSLVRNPTYSPESFSQIQEFITILFDDKCSNFFSPSYTRTLEYISKYIKFTCKVYTENTASEDVIILLNNILCKSLNLYTRICVMECNGKRTFMDVLSKLFNRLGEIQQYWKLRMKSHPLQYEDYMKELKDLISASMTNIDSVEALIAPLENYAGIAYEIATNSDKKDDTKPRSRLPSEHTNEGESKSKIGSKIRKTTGVCHVDANTAFDIKLKERMACLDPARALFPLYSQVQDEFHDWMLLFARLTRCSAENVANVTAEINDKKPEIVGFQHVFSLLTHLGSNYSVNTFNVVAVFIQCVFEQLQVVKQVNKEETRQKKDKAEFLASMNEITMYVMILHMAYLGPAPSMNVKFECIGMVMSAASKAKTYHAFTDFAFRAMQACIFDSIIQKTSSIFYHLDMPHNIKFTVPDNYNVFMHLYMEKEQSYVMGLTTFYTYVLEVMPELFISRLQTILFQIGCSNSGNQVTKDGDTPPQDFHHVHTSLLSEIFSQVVKLRSAQSVLEIYLDSAEQLIRVMVSRKSALAFIPHMEMNRDLMTSICASLSHTGKMLLWEKFHLLFQTTAELCVEHGHEKLVSGKHTSVFFSKYKDGMEDLLFMYYHLLDSIEPLPELDNEPILKKLQSGNELLRNMIKITTVDSMYADKIANKVVLDYKVHNCEQNEKELDVLYTKPRLSCLNLTHMAMFSNSLVNLSFKLSKNLLGEISSTYSMLLGKSNTSQLTQEHYVSHFCHLHSSMPLHMLLEKYVYRKRKNEQHESVEKALLHSAALRLKYMIALHPTLITTDTSKMSSFEQDLARDNRQLAIYIARYINTHANEADGDMPLLLMITSDSSLFHAMAAFQDPDCDAALVSCVSRALTHMPVDGSTNPVFAIEMLEYTESARILSQSVCLALKQCVADVFVGEKDDQGSTAVTLAAKWISGTKKTDKITSSMTDEKEEKEQDDEEEPTEPVKKKKRMSLKQREKANSDDEGSDEELAPFPQEVELVALDKDLEVEEDVEYDVNFQKLLRTSNLTMSKWEEVTELQLPAKFRRNIKDAVSTLTCIFTQYVQLPYHLRQQASNTVLVVFLAWYYVLKQASVTKSLQMHHTDLVQLLSLVELAIQSSVHPPDHKVSTHTGKILVSQLGKSLGTWNTVPVVFMNYFFTHSNQASLYLALLLTIESTIKDKMMGVLESILDKKKIAEVSKMSEKETFIRKVYLLAFNKKATLYSLELLYTVCSRLPKNTSPEMLTKLHKFVKKIDTKEELCNSWKHACLGQLSKLANGTGSSSVDAEALLSVVQSSLASKKEVSRDVIRVCMKILGCLVYSDLTSVSTARVYDKKILGVHVPVLLRVFFTCVEVLSLCVSQFGVFDIITVTMRKVVAGMFLRAMSIPCIAGKEVIGSNVVLGMILHTLLFSMETDYNDVGVHAYWNYSRFPCTTTYGLVMCDLIGLILNGGSFASSTDIPTALVELGVTQKGVMYTFFAFTTPIFSFLHGVIITLTEKLKSAQYEDWSLYELVNTREYIQSILPTTLNVEELSVTYTQARTVDIPTHTKYLGELFLLSKLLQAVSAILVKTVSSSVHFDHVLLCLVPLSPFFTASSSSTSSEQVKECFFYVIAHVLCDEYLGITKALMSHHAGVVRRHFMAAFLKQVILLLTHLLKWGDKYRRMSPSIIDEQVYTMSRVITFICTPDEGNVLSTQNYDIQKAMLKHMGVFCVHILRTYVNLCKNPVVALTNSQQQLLQASVGQVVRILEEKYIVEVGKQQDDTGKNYLQYLLAMQQGTNKR